MKVSVMFARFPYQNQECPDSVDWYCATVVKAKSDPRIDTVTMARYDDTPITMTRNLAAKNALASGADYLVMLDSDMCPDLPGQQPFWDTSLDFVLKHRDTPCIVGAPYCGPPPHENVYVFKLGNLRNGDPDQGYSIQQYTREEVVPLSGIRRVAALPTGLVIIDTRVFRAMPPRRVDGLNIDYRSWFYYEWSEPECSSKASTEDVTFTRDVTLAGIPNYCNWSSWAGHWKRICVGKPRPVTVDQIREKYVEAVRTNRHSGDRLLDVPPGGFRLRNGVPELAANGKA